MNSHEEATVRSFIEKSRRARWLEALASPKRRRSFLDRLNHCSDFDERYASPIASGGNVNSILTSRGAAATCHVISDSPELDGRELLLAEAIELAESNGWGAILSCVPGRLAYYYGETGTRRLLLERSSDSIS